MASLIHAWRRRQQFAWDRSVNHGIGCHLPNRAATGPWRRANKTGSSDSDPAPAAPLKCDAQRNVENLFASALWNAGTLIAAAHLRPPHNRNHYIRGSRALRALPSDRRADRLSARQRGVPLSFCVAAFFAHCRGVFYRVSGLIANDVIIGHSQLLPPAGATDGPEFTLPLYSPDQGRPRLTSARSKRCGSSLPSRLTRSRRQRGQHPAHQPRARFPTTQEPHCGR
jgi:hypothetical protein